MQNKSGNTGILLKGMGYNDVEGFIWYVDRNKIMKV